MAAVDEAMAKALQSNEPKLKEMCEYMVATGGKKIRPAVCILSHLACGGARNKREVINVGAAFEIIHSATLIHDDINDQGELRRGRKALYRQYSISRSIITGDFMFAMGFRLLGRSSSAIVDFVVEASAAMGESEFIQKDFEHTPRVTEADYIEIIRGKTAMPIVAAAKSGAYLSGADHDTIEAIGDYALDVGLAFQIIDDTLDIVGDTEKTGKRIGVDLIEGKPTLPVIYAMRHPVYGDRIRSVFSRDGTSQDDVEEVIGLMKKTDAVERCREKAYGYADRAISYLSVLEDSVYKDALVDLANYVVRRDR
jgi:octaprenyl-diphosphate synthase